jgi:Lrp/AsnC family leucine-responsive transcriptional regulator
MTVSRSGFDAIDERILGLLEHDARQSASEIGRTVGLSSAAVQRRIDHLEETRVITGYRATLNYARLGNQLEAFAQVRFAGGTGVERMNGTFADLPELVEAFTTAGDPDAIVRVRVRDVGHLRDVINCIRRDSRVTSTKTLIVLSPAATRSRADGGSRGAR